MEEGRSRTRHLKPKAAELPAEEEAVYSSRLRIRRHVRKISYEEEGDWDEEYYGRGRSHKGKRGRGKVFRNRVCRQNGNPRPANDSKMMPLEKLLDWRRRYVEPGLIEDSYLQFTVPSIKAADLEKYGRDVQAIFINIDWLKNGIEDIKELELSSKLMKNGIVFIWSHKAFIADIMEAMAAKKFKYIENLCVSMIRVGSLVDDLKNPEGAKQLFHNKMAESTLNPTDCFFSGGKSDYFSTTKKILLMFHRVSSSNLEPWE